MQYGLVRKEDYEKEISESIQFEEASDLLKDMVETEND